MSKSPDAFRTISEVADWLDTPAHVLRFWESRFFQIKPVKRAGGRRYYRPSDMLLLGGIKKLLHDDGTTIKAVQNILREKGVKNVQAMSQPVSVQVVLKKKSPALAATEPVPEQPPQEAAKAVTQEPLANAVTPPADKMILAQAGRGEAALTMIDMPARIKSASDIHAQDIPEIEALYYSLKMIRNNMRRTGAGR